MRMQASGAMVCCKLLIVHLLILGCTPCDNLELIVPLYPADCGIIGASLSEPHTSESNGGFFIYIMAYGRYAICRDDPEKNGVHIKSAQMTRSKCLRWISQRPP